MKSAPKGIKVPYSEQALAQLTRDPGKMPARRRSQAPDPKPELAQRLAAHRQPRLHRLRHTTGSGSTAPGHPRQRLHRPSSRRAGMQQARKALHGYGRRRANCCIRSTRGPIPKGWRSGAVPGQPVVASAAGKVVYSGSGLRGYGKLIIIKHNNTYLSVYAHNRELLVKEGERVSKGQKIAEMGSTDSERVACISRSGAWASRSTPSSICRQEGAS